jgi:hypothetical protein
MANVYSTRMLSAFGVTSDIARGPPAGFVWVLKTLDAYYDNLAVGTARLKAFGGSTIWVNTFSATAGPLYASWRGMYVLKPGETFVVNSSQPTDINVNGYQLSLP